MIKFCEEYIKDFNASRAAKEAGYNPNTAPSIGAENLKKPQIQEYIKQITDKRAERTKITADRVVQEFAKIAFAHEDNLEGFTKLELKDKIKALESLAKHTGAYNKDESEKTNVHIEINKWLEEN